MEDIHAPHSPRPSEAHRTGAGVAKRDVATLRKRITRACDQCNQMRTKCDGQNPCAHCKELHITCEYAREKKKRGKTAKKDLDIKAREAADSTDTVRPESRQTSTASSAQILPSYNDLPHGAISEPEISRTRLPPLEHDPHSYAAPLTATTDHISNNHHHLNHSHINSLTSQTFPEIGPTIQNNHGNTQDMHYALQNEADMQTHANGQTYRGYIENNFPMHDAQSSVRHNTTFDFLLDSPAMGLTNMGSPGFITLPSPSSVSSVPGQRQRSAPPCRYPVVAPLIPLIGSFLSQSLACELLDHYFETASHSSSLPTSPYILAFVYRRKSFLDPYKPRWRSPALLASMLYVAAQTSDAPYLSSTPTRRSQICQKLFQIAVFSLRPLIHGSFSTAASQTGPSNLESGFVLGGLVSFDQPGAEKSTHASLDDVATYMHLATVVSASEFKRASLRWWGGAWYLAKELQLGQEVTHDSHAYELYPDMTEDGQGDGKPPVIGEEEREERRRIWWILYIAERHLALCYNSPVMLLDRECQDLIQPLDEEVWQTGAFLHPDFPHASRRRGPPVEFTGSSVFGYVLPLMNILGQIVQLQDMRNQPRFSPALRDPSIWDAHVEDINSQLDAFARSMRTYQALMIDETTTALPPNATPFHPGPAHSSESNMLAKTAVAYATHMMHVLHILVAGKWDPIALFDDADGWISSPSFVTATGHAVGAADALSQVLELDPDLSFMPFLYGIYLLQGSFLLLLLADKLQQDAGAPVVRACETIVRAHEACVVTLSTEYQRNFRRVMRSALQQVRGRVTEDFGEARQRRREVLALYRWVGGGRGLAL